MSTVASGLTGWASNRRIVVPVGLALLAFSLILIFPVAIVLPLIVAWWLHLDLSDPLSDELGWLGIASLILFGVVGAAVLVIVVSIDTHFQCGGTLGGFGESASAQLDQTCVGERGWRPVIGAMALLVATGVAGFRLRDLAEPAGRWGAPRAVTISAGLMMILVLVTALLVLT